MTELEQHLQSIPHTLAMNPQAQALRSLLEAVVVARNSRDAIAALGLLQKVLTILPQLASSLLLVRLVSCGDFMSSCILWSLSVDDTEQVLSLEI